MHIGHSKSPIVQLSVEFSLMVIKYAEQLEANNKRIIGDQLLINGTTLGAHIMEAQSAETSDEYFEKMRVADRKAHDTWYWLYLCEESAGYGHNKELSKKLDEVMKVLHTIILSANKLQ